MEIGRTELADSPAARLVPLAPGPVRAALTALTARFDAVAGREYVGTFTLAEWYRVRVHESDGSVHPLQQLVYHSPGGFAWGYGGSGPSDLALAILTDATADVRLAWLLHHSFKFAVVAHWPAWEGERDAAADEPYERWRYPATDALGWVERVLSFGTADARSPADLAEDYAEVAGLSERQLGIRERRYPRENG